MRYTAAPQRRAELLRQVSEIGYLSSAAAATELGVSAMTIRRDLRDLAAQGLVRRVAGGASVAAAPGAPFEHRRGAATAQKRTVARAAAGLLSGEAVLAMDAGTTLAALAGQLGGGCTVITHSVPVVLACAERADIELICVGGGYHAKTRSFVGPLTRGALAQLAADVAVLSATAAGPGGVYSANAQDAETKRAMAAIARRVVLLLDSAKLTARAPIKVMELAAVDTVVVDDGADEEQLAALRAACREVIVAPLAADGAAP